MTTEAAIDRALPQQVIDEIVRRVLTVAKPERIVLLDFPVAERQGRELDVDLLVVEKDPGDPRARSVRVGDALRGLGLPISAVVITPRFLGPHRSRSLRARSASDARPEGLRASRS